MRLILPFASACLALLLLGGCATPGRPSPAPAAPGPAVSAPAAQVPEAPASPAPALSLDPGARCADLELEVARLQGLRGEEAKEFRRRLAAMERERDLAVAEVVRMRARMQGLVSQAEAGAMYAEARVLLDRMEEDAYSTEARDNLATARKRLEEGKAALDKGNPAGASFLFDQLSNLYEGFRKGNPRRLVVAAPEAVLRAAPAPGGKVVADLHAGDPLEGIARQDRWVQVRDASGRKGWVPSEAVR